MLVVSMNNRTPQNLLKPATIEDDIDDLGGRGEEEVQKNSVKIFTCVVPVTSFVIQPPPPPPHFLIEWTNHPHYIALI